MLRVHPYRQGSKGAKSLATALGGKVLKREGSSFSPSAGDVVINWGDSQCPDFSPARLLNPPAAVALAANKAQAFERLAEAGVSIPRFATTAGNVSWAGATVVRHKLTGHSGEGIEIVEPGGQLPDAPLYVEYVKKKDEYRVHVLRHPVCNKIRERLSCDECGYPLSEAAGCGDHLGPCDKGASIILVQRKARDTSNPNPNWQVRSHANGFVFVRQNVNPPPGVVSEARAALNALGLDFGAVDVIWNDQTSRAYVLEVNTAPGMEGSTIDDYGEAFNRFLSSL